MALINYLTRIQFEVGAVGTLANELTALDAKNPLIVADKGVVAAGIVDHVLSSSGLGADTIIFDDTPENPTEAAALWGAEVYRAAGCDAIVAIGGGSPIDLAKAVSLLITHAKPLAQYAAISGGVERITADKPPLIAVPTTSGTGSEVGRASLITLEDGRKLGFISPHMIPNVAICDPELTLALPAHLTAATGMDAITHCIETYCSPRYNPVADAIALDGLSRAFKWIERAVFHGSDLEARTQMMMAALQGGLTFQKGLGAVHSLSHPLGGLKEYRLHHGTLNAVLLPAVLRFNRQAIGHKDTELARAMGLGAHADVSQAICRLTKHLGMPTTLSAMGVKADTFEVVCKGASADHSTATNPRSVSEDAFRVLLEESLN